MSESDRVDRPLSTQLKDIRLSVSQAISNVRLISIGAPFTSEIVHLAERDLLDALRTCRAAEAHISDLSRHLGAEGGQR